MPRVSLCSLLIFIIGCSHSNPPEYNTIVFTARVEVVADSIDFVVSVMDTLRKKRDIVAYIMDNDGTSLSWRFHAVDLEQRRLNDPIPDLAVLSPPTGQRFLSAIQFLRKNHLTSYAIDQISGEWLFSYRYRPVLLDDDFRYIVPGRTESQVERFRRIRTVLDHKGPLLLVAKPNAIVR